MATPRRRSFHAPRHPDRAAGFSRDLLCKWAAGPASVTPDPARVTCRRCRDLLTRAGRLHTLQEKKEDPMIKCFRCQSVIEGEPTVVVVLGPTRTVANYCAACANCVPTRRS